MRLRVLLGSTLATVLLNASAISAGNLEYCPKGMARVEVTRLDGGPPLLVRQDHLVRYFPDRALRMGISGVAILTCRPSQEQTPCVVLESAPSDPDFGRSGVLMARLFRLKDAAVIRVDFTILVRDYCADPLSRPPSWRP